MNAVRRALADRVMDFCGLTIEECDRQYIQKPLEDQTLKIRVVRWKTLPTAAFRKLDEVNPESTGTFEELQHDAFVHGPRKLLFNGSGRDTYCEHTPGAAYVVDPDARDRVEQYMKLWTHSADQS
jgi:hypothetical protein